MGACKKRLPRKAAARLLAVCLVLALVLGAAGSAGAANVTKKSVSRSIGIVFDNSGSMYMMSNQAWCQATYAVEVFAAMMNQGDLLQVYPMSEIEAGGRIYSDRAPLSVSGGSDVSVIRDIYTPWAGDTPIETVKAAYEGLMQTTADEKWLIVLTDGQIFYEGYQELPGDQTRQRLSEVLSGYNDSVNVIYLGIGDLDVPDITGSYASYGSAVSSAGVPDELSRICNMIFGRDQLPESYMSPGQVRFDIPMSKLIIFVQGENVSGVSLKAEDGTELTPVSTYSPQYSTKGAGDGFSGQAVPDTTLQGMLVTYENCQPGTYSLTYAGASRSIAAYYEPDVDVSALLTDANGNPVDVTLPQQEAGQYSLQYGFVDAGGGFITSELLGQQNYEITYRINGEEQTVTANEAGFIPLDMSAGDTLDADVAVTFLSGYRVSKTGQDLGWPDLGIQFGPKGAGTLDMDVSGGGDSYKLSRLEQEGVYRVTLTHDGTPVTGEMLDQASLDARISGGNAVCAVEKDAEGFTLRMQYAGSAAQTQCGDYTVDLLAYYTSEDSLTAQCGQTLSFTLDDEVSRLEMDLEAPQKHFVLSKLDRAKPMTVTVTMDGQPLTAEQMAQAELSVDSEAAFHVEKLPEQSAFRVTPAREPAPANGRYRVAFTATAADTVGRTISAEEATHVRFQPFSDWVLYLMVLGGLLALAALIALYLNVKRLPKRIGVSFADTRFTVGGRIVEGDPKCRSPKSCKKKASVSVEAPEYVLNPMATAGIAMNLEAVSPRRIKSSRRRAKVVGVSVLGDIEPTSVNIGAKIFTVEKDTGRLINPVSPTAPATPFEIGNNAIITISGKVPKPTGGTSAAAFSSKLKFR